MHFNVAITTLLLASTAASYKLDRPNLRGKAMWKAGHPSGVNDWAHAWGPGYPQEGTKHHKGHKKAHKSHEHPGIKHQPTQTHKSKTEHKTKPRGPTSTRKHPKPGQHPPHPDKSHTKQQTKHKNDAHPSPTDKPRPSQHAEPNSNQHRFNYKNAVLHHHNVHRRNHSSPAIKWDIGLASTAAKIASSCVYAHDTQKDGGGYGQNIAAGIAPDGISNVVSDMFYNGEVNYFNGLYGDAHPDMSNFGQWGHFSQLIWAASTHVGCATKYCPDGLKNTGRGVRPYFTVCNYAGTGNVAGRYSDNIGKPLGRATVRGASAGYRRGQH